MARNKLRSDDVVQHMALAERLALSRAYDQLSNLESLRHEEREAWRELADFDEATALEHQDLMRLRGLITRVDALNGLIETNQPYLRRTATELGISPKLAIAPPSGLPSVCGTILPADGFSASQ